MASGEASRFGGCGKDGCQRAGGEFGWKHTIVVDSHNSEGSPPSTEESKEVVDASRSVLEKLRSFGPLPFSAGFAHSSELGLKFGADVAPGGVGVLVISSVGGRWGMVSFDANNAVTHLRERLMASLAQDGVSVLEICTSDTHFTAARTLGGKGYIALGQLTEFQEIERKVRLLTTKAIEKLSDAKVEIKLAYSTVSTMSESVIETFSRTLDRTLSVAKRGGVGVLLIFGIALVGNVLLAL